MHGTRKQVVATFEVGWVRLHFALWQPCAASKPRVIKVIRVSRRNDAWAVGKSITKACAVNHIRKYRSGGLTRHRLRIATALDKIILMIFDELMVERATAVGLFGVRLPAHPRAGPDAGDTP